MITGNFTITEIITGTFALDGGAMFGVIPKTLWERSNPADHKNRIAMVTRSLLIRDGIHTILVDTGMGEKWSEKHREIYKLDFSKHSLTKGLAREGLYPDDITHVILTHLHFDHTGGSIYEQQGLLKPYFPNAQYFTLKEQWDWALSPSEKDRASFIKDNFIPLQLHNQLTLLNSPKEFPLTGITGYVSYGHTKGMWLPIISDENQTVVYCADLIPTTSHVPIPYVMGYDNHPLIAMKEKKEFLQNAVKKNWILTFEHDPLCSAATVKDSSKGIVIDKKLSL